MTPHASLKRINENTQKLVQEPKVFRKYTNCAHTGYRNWLKEQSTMKRKKLSHLCHCYCFRAVDPEFCIAFDPLWFLGKVFIGQGIGSGRN